MEDTSLLELCVEEDVIQALCTASDSSTLENSLHALTELSRTEHGRSKLASQNIVSYAIKLIKSLPFPSGREFLVSSLRLLRNLCAGETKNQDSFVELNGVGAILSVLKSVRACSSEVDYGIMKVCLQVIANVSLGGEEHQQAIQSQLFPREFLSLAKIRSRAVSDPLCMVVFTCCNGNPGLPIAREILKTTSLVGFGEDWLKLILSTMCLEQTQLYSLFSELSIDSGTKSFSDEQAFLLRIMSEILNERIEEREFSVSNDFADCVLQIFKMSVNAVGSETRGESGLPTGSSEIDVLGYSLTMLRDICAQESPSDSNKDNGVLIAVDVLISSGIVTLLLSLLRDLEPPATIKKAMEQGTKSRDGTSFCSLKPCPYKGFRRDLVAAIGNCAYRRQHVQDYIRESDVILLLLQQCVADEDNPFLREWGIWCVRNLLEGNAENQQAVAELEIKGSVDSPELAGLGLRVEVDSNSGRAKLVNIPAKQVNSVG